MNIKYNQWLDVCRAIAILLVMFSHGRRLLFPLFPNAQFFKFGGFLGVEIFFVLSGFLIGKILMTKSMESDSRWRWIPHFWGRRWLRTYPNYLLFLLANALVINSWRPDVEPDWWRYLTFTQSLWSAHPSFFGEAWSLVIEEIFYFVIPLLMIVIWCKSATQALLHTLFLVLFTSLISRIAVVYLEPGLTFNQIRSMALLRLDSIMIGVFAAYIYWQGGIWRDRMCLLAPWCALLLIPVIVITMQSDKLMDDNRLLKVLLFPMANIGAAGLLVMGLTWSCHKIVYSIALRIARWSYSAYLINLLVLTGMGFYLPPPTATTTLFYWFGFMITTLALSAAVYYLFERNVLVWRDSWIK